MLIWIKCSVFLTLIFTSEVLKTSEKTKFSSKKHIFCSISALKTAVRWCFHHAHNKAEVSAKLKFLYFIVVQGENTIARRRRDKLFSIDYRNSIVLRSFQ